MKMRRAKAWLLFISMAFVLAMGIGYAAAQQAVQEEIELYTVKSGDTLSKIAETFYGSIHQYTQILEANWETIKDVNAIYPGQVIRIPKKAQAETDWKFHDIVDVAFVQQYAKVPQPEGVMIIDSRPYKPKYVKGHIPTAVNIPGSQFDKMTAKLPQDKKALLIFYCGGPT